jgi:hypothetical protein
MAWYSRVSRDITQIPAAIQHFETELQAARLECKLKGNVEKQSAEMPGISADCFSTLPFNLHSSLAA